MLSNIAVLSLAVAGAVSGSPLQARQATSSGASLSSAISSAAANVTSRAANATSAAVTGTPTMPMNVSSTATVIGSPSATAVTGNQSYPAYPCPAGYLLTYVQLNETLAVPLATAKSVFGNWSTSPFFPNATNSTGGNRPGAMHTLNIAAANVSLTEVLVNVTTDASTGLEQWIWNNTGAPVSALGVSVSNYSTVLQLYTPTNGTNATSMTMVKLFTNLCASSQPLGMELVMTLGQLELGNLMAAVARRAGGSTTSAAMSSAATMASSVVSSASVRSNMTTSIRPGNATSMAATAVSGATSLPASAATAAVSAASSALSSA